MPFLGILHASLDLGLYVSSLLHPVYALTGSLMFLAGWSVQAGFWAQCDLTSNRETATQGQCYQSYIQTQPKNGDLVGISTTLTNAKVGFGFLLLIM